jgi:heparan-alpha-glucosaminide N-acetyltransferase
MTTILKSKKTATTHATQHFARIASIDILRAITMLLMIFVNDLWSLTNIPKWLEHTPADFDGMGFADVIFPAFLFIVGMSIPFAIDNRRKKGETDLQIIGHVLMRSGALLIMGVFLVNGENINEEATGMSRLIWGTLSCTAFILIWNSYKAATNKNLIWTLKLIGAATLLTLSIIYKGGPDDSLNGFSTYWWGILGLIGWAYLVSGIVYTRIGHNFTALVLMWMFFHVMCIATHAGWYSAPFLTTLFGPLGGGAFPALILGGIILSKLYLHFKTDNSPGSDRKFLLTLLGMATLLHVAGLLLRPYWGISKIHATPSWILICSAITILAFVFVYILADIRGKAFWFKSIKPGGTNTLVCYLIPYFAYTVVTYSGFNFPEFMLSGIAGLFKSFAFAYLSIALAGLLEKRGVQLKL